MKPEFHEDYHNPDADPSGHAVEEFPYEEVFARLDGVPSPDSERGMADVVKGLLGWTVDVHFQHRSSHRIIAARAVAALWVANPGAFGGQSLRSIASATGLSFDHLTRASAAFSRQFGIRSRAQSHAWNYKPHQGAGEADPLSEHSRANKAARRPRGASRRAIQSDGPAATEAGKGAGTRQNMPKESFAAGGRSAGGPSSRRSSSADPNPSVP